MMMQKKMNEFDKDLIAIFQLIFFVQIEFLEMLIVLLID